MPKPCTAWERLRLQAGHAADAVRLLEQAIAIDPKVAEYHNNLGSAYLTIGRQRRSLCSVRRGDPTRSGNAGRALQSWAGADALGQLDEAAASYRRSNELRPANPFAHNNLGDLLRELGSPGRGALTI